MAKDEPIREKYIVELIELRARLFAEELHNYKRGEKSVPDENMVAVESEIKRHPAPASSSKSLSKALVGEWVGDRYGDHFHADGTCERESFHGWNEETWSVHGNQLHQSTGGDGPTIILINSDYFVVSVGTGVNIETRVTPVNHHEE